MPSVDLSPQTFSRLQGHAIPLVDSIETVISRLIDSYESQAAAGGALSVTRTGPAVREFNPASPPDLTHTKLLAAEFCGKSLDNNQVKWNGLFEAAVRAAKQHSKNAADLKRLVASPCVEGQKLDEGFRYIPDLGISIQGRDADGAWKAACHIAQKLGLPLTVTFVWREKDKAAHPGVTGRMSVPGR